MRDEKKMSEIALLGILAAISLIASAYMIYSSFKEKMK